MKTLYLATILALAISGPASANDGVYFTSGNFLVPVHETDIAVNKEILTITIGKDSMATVDVWYELSNKNQAKNVTMAFEASASYNDLAPLNRQGIHPSIKDFTVRMNGKILPYRNAVVACRYADDVHQVDFTPLDLSQWKGYGEVPDSILPENNVLYNSALNRTISFAYAYYFDAKFVPGTNTVHHTYSYRMSYDVMTRFTIPYWLTPVTRWANHQVDDFTLRITSEEPVSFCMKDSLFRSAPFTSVKGGKVFRVKDEYGEPLLFAPLSLGDTIVWHGRDFRPTGDMDIESPAWERDPHFTQWQTSADVVVTPDGQEFRYLADGKDYYLVRDSGYAQIPKNRGRIVKYSAEKGQGWLCVDTVMATHVNVRSQPSTRSRVLGIIDGTGTYRCRGLVTVRQGDMSKEWYRIQIGDAVGYISRDMMIWKAVREDKEQSTNK